MTHLMSDYGFKTKAIQVLFDWIVWYSFSFNGHVITFHIYIDVIFVFFLHI